MAMKGLILYTIYWFARRKMLSINRQSFTQIYVYKMAVNIRELGNAELFKNQE